MKFSRMYHHHKKVIHISLGIVTTFIGILWIFFSANSASAAVPPIVKKNVTTLTKEQIEAEKTTIETTKSGLESQIVTEKNKLSENRALQIKLYTEVETLKELITGWKELEKNFKKYKENKNDLEVINTKIVATNKATDKAKKTELEAKKGPLEEALEQNIAYIKTRDEAVNLSISTITNAIITEAKSKADADLVVARNKLKEAKTEKKNILKSQNTLKKTIKDAGSYITKLANQALKLLNQTTGTGTCTDGIRNGTETGVDTGGRCVTTRQLNTGTCTDGIRNGTETGVDTGGRCNGITGTGTCTDGIRNADETGVDNGGRCGTVINTGTCTDGIRNADETGVDTGGRCPATIINTGTCTDGIRNADETGVDTGGRCPAIIVNPGYTMPNSGYLLIPTARATATAVANGDGTVADVKTGGSGYIYPPLVIVSGTGTCTQFPTATSTIKNGILKSITLTGGVCSKAPTLSISAPQVTATAVVNENAARTASITNSGFGYLGAPEVKVTATAAACTTRPTATTTIMNSKVTAVTLSQNAFCTGKPTLTIDPPMIPATATVTKKDDSHFTVNVTENGAGYAAKPLITVTGTTCAVIPRAVVTMDADKIGGITLEGAVKCPTAPTIAIEKPDRIGVLTTIENTEVAGTVYSVNPVTATATMTRGATGYSSATASLPPVTIGDCTNGTKPTKATAVVSATGVVTGITFTGAPNCPDIPTVVIDPPTGNDPANTRATARITATAITATLNPAGSGYTTAAASVAGFVTVGGCDGGTKPTVRGTVNTSGGVVLTISGTTDCPTPPTITIAPPTLPGGVQAIATVKITGIKATITNGGTGKIIPTIVKPGAGYAFPPNITATGGVCPGGLKVRTKIIDGMLTDPITFDGVCTTLPTFVIPAPQVQATATMVLDANKKPTSINVTNPGGGYIFTPNITIAAGKCTGTITPVVEMINGYIKKIDLTVSNDAVCSAVPTLTLEKPSDPATATAAKTFPDTNNPGIDKFIVELTKPGIGYKIAPRVTVTGACKVYPHPVVTLEGTKVKTIELKGGVGCPNTLTLAIEAPTKIDIGGANGFEGELTTIIP